MCKRGLRSWVRDERGAVAVYLALGTAIFFPMIALAIDATNYYKLNTELKQAADAAALAAATELDWTDEGLVAAENAARTAVQNLQTGATDAEGSEVDIATVQFLRALPPAGNYNYGDYVTADATEARYVRVITETRTRESVAYGALVALWGGDSNDGLKATAEDAVAGKVTVACKAMPIFMCNPAEIGTDGDGNACGNSEVADFGDGYDSFAEFLKDHPEWRRRQFRIKWIGPQTSIEPGVFGLLQPITGSFPGSGANAIAHELAITDPSSCVVIEDNELEVKTGQTQAIVNGLNVRFDIYRGMFGGKKNDPDYAPGLNRTKGHLPSSLGGSGSDCDPQEMTYPDGVPPEVMKEPQDSCFESQVFSGECGSLGAPDPEDPQGNYAGRYGDGQWDALTYFDVNHRRSDLTSWADHPVEFEDLLEFIHDNYGNDYYGAPYLSQDDDESIAPVDALRPPSRWAVYRWEMAGSGTALTEDRVATEPLPPNPDPSVPDGQYEDRIPGLHTRVDTITREEGVSGMAGATGAQCSTQTPLGPARRTLYVAVTNCCEQSENLSSGQRRIKITEWAETFITEPAQANNSGGNTGDLGAIYVEVFNAVNAYESDRVVLRDYVQLY